MDNVARLKIIRESIQQVRASKSKISSQTWGVAFSNKSEIWDFADKTRTCCPLGAVLIFNQFRIGKPNDHRQWMLQTILQCDQNWISSFNRGFDNHQYHTVFNREVFDIGRVILTEISGKNNAKQISLF